MEFGENEFALRQNVAPLSGSKVIMSSHKMSSAKSGVIRMDGIKPFPMENSHSGCVASFCAGGRPEMSDFPSLAAFATLHGQL
jgi:hypothetical protein